MKELSLSLYSSSHAIRRDERCRVKTAILCTCGIQAAYQWSRWWKKSSQHCSSELEPDPNFSKKKKKKKGIPLNLDKLLFYRQERLEKPKPWIRVATRETKKNFFLNKWINITRPGGEKIGRAYIPEGKCTKSNRSVSPSKTFLRTQSVISKVSLYPISHFILSLLFWRILVRFPSGKRGRLNSHPDSGIWV